MDEAMIAFLSEIGERVQRAFQPVIDGMQELEHTLQVAAWTAYREAGSPDGDIDIDGLVGWLGKQSAIAQARATSELHEGPREGAVWES